MEVNGLKIIAPEGMEYYIENNEVKFRPISKKLTYNDIIRELFDNKNSCFINSKGDIEHQIISGGFYKDATNCTSEKQAKKLLAINQLMNVAKYLNKDWKPNWNNNNECKYFILISSYENKIIIDCNTSFLYNIIYFKLEELAQQAIDILGEETIRLALCTDW